jgi:uncharacterized integral membrane protein
MSFEQTDPGREAASGGRQLPSLKLVSLAVVAVATVVFFFQNGEQAQVNFLWMDGEWSLRLVIIVSVLAGVVIDRLGSWLWARGRRRKQQARRAD